MHAQRLGRQSSLAARMQWTRDSRNQSEKERNKQERETDREREKNRASMDMIINESKTRPGRLLCLSKTCVACLASVFRQPGASGASGALLQKPYRQCATFVRVVAQNHLDKARRQARTFHILMFRLELLLSEAQAPYRVSFCSKTCFAKWAPGSMMSRESRTMARSSAARLRLSSVRTSDGTAAAARRLA